MQLLRHAHKVQQRGYYLHFVDLLMAASMQNATVKLILNTPHIQVLSVHEYLTSCFARDFPDNLGVSSGNGPIWTVILTTASYRPSDDLQDLNHWIPAWHESELQSLDKQFDLQSFIREGVAHSQQAVRSIEDFEESMRQQAVHGNWCMLLERLSQPDLRYSAREVPKDGNCGVWTIVSLDGKNPWMSVTSDHETDAAMMKLRKGIAAGWSNMSQWKVWQQLFFDLALEELEAEDEADASDVKDVKVKKEVDDEDISNQNDQQEGDDLDITPPKKARKLDPDELESMPEPKLPDPAKSLKLEARFRISSMAGLVESRSKAKAEMKFETKAELSKEQLDQLLQAPPDAVEASQEAPKKRRKKNKQGALTEQEEKKVRLESTERFLSDRGLDYGAWQAEHSAFFRATRAAKGKVCPGGGYKVLKTSLKDGQKPTCPCCSDLLLQHGIALPRLLDFLDQQVQMARNPDMDGSDIPQPQSIQAKNNQNENNGGQPAHPESQDQPENPETPNADGGGGADDDDDDLPPEVVRLVKADKCLKLLPQGTHRKRHPVRCLICINVKGESKIFDLVSLSTDKYLRQHIETSKHRKAQANQGNHQHDQGDDDDDQGDPKAQRPQRDRHPEPHGDGDGEVSGVGDQVSMCLGFQFEFFPQTRISQLHKEFHTYASYCNLNSAKHINGEGHSYQHNLSNNSYTIFHRRCEKTVRVSKSLTAMVAEEGRGSEHQQQMLNCQKVCVQCRSLGTCKSFVKNVARFNTKIWAARLLRSKLYLHELPQEVEKEMMESKLAALCLSVKKEFETIVSLTIPELQRWVRTSFLCTPEKSTSHNLQMLVAGLVVPAVQVSPHVCSEKGAAKAEMLARYMTQGKLVEVDDVEIKLGCYVAGGLLQNHPLLQGILVSVCDKLRRESRGVLSMRNLQISDQERSMMSEAGVALSMAACNKTLAREFAMMSNMPRVQVHTLLDRSIPDPFLAVCDDKVLQQNGLLVDRAFDKPADGCFRRLCLAFDKTYLLKQMNVVRHRLGKGLVGVSVFVFSIFCFLSYLSYLFFSTLHCS